MFHELADVERRDERLVDGRENERPLLDAKLSLGGMAHGDLADGDAGALKDVLGAKPRLVGDDRKRQPSKRRQHGVDRCDVVDRMSLRGQLFEPRAHRRVVAVVERGEERLHEVLALGDEFRLSRLATIDSLRG